MQEFDTAWIHQAQEMTLLYIEDNSDTREMTAMLLKDLFGTVILARDGEEGLAQFDVHAVDMILTDISLPKLNGIEMLQMIRKEDQNVSMVILSAYGDEDYLVDSIAVGVDGYLKKPIDIDAFFELASRIVQKYRFAKETQNRMRFLEAHRQATDLNALVSKTDPSGIITYVNDAFCAVSGYRREELLGKKHNIIRHPDNPDEMFRDMWNTIQKEKQVWRGVVRNRAKNGKSYYVDSLIMPVLDPQGNVIEYISPRNNITEIMQPSRQLQNALVQFYDQALLYLKIKNFDMLEDFYDSVTLEKIQEKISKFLLDRFEKFYDFDRIYSLDNGEFALLVALSNSSSEQEKDAFIEELKELQQKMGEEETIRINGIGVRMAFILSFVSVNDRVLESAKFGIRELVRTHGDFIVADQMALWKKTRTQHNMKMVDMIHEALRNSLVVSCFQPIVDNKTGKIVKYESLVRLADGDRNVVAPQAFLDISKTCGCYPQITEKVFENSFAILDKTDADISINISIADIEHRPTRTMILDFLERHRAQAGRLVFELLENEMTRDYDRIYAFVTQIKSYGARIAIDDFGSGYSNYERLLSYRPDILKIDGSLIRTMEHNSYSLSIVRSIVAFAKEQELDVVAEFVENEAIFEIVKNLGIKYSQGYLFGRPERFP